MFLRPGGYAVVTSPYGGTIRLDRRGPCEEIREGTHEYDSFSCGHCSKVTHVKARHDPAELGGLCKVCMKLICCNCVGKRCHPFEKKLERWEAKEIARRSYGI